VTDVTQQQLVDPDRLMVVTILDAGRALDLVAVSCRYLPATDAKGRRAIALEITHDPARPSPTTAYLLPAELLHRRLIDPRALQRVRPYRP
jgi:hypothetical protein